MSHGHDRRLRKHASSIEESGELSCVEASDQSKPGANEGSPGAHCASGSGTTPVSTAMRNSSGLASQVAW